MSNILVKEYVCKRRTKKKYIFEREDMIKRTRKREWSEGVFLMGRYEWFGTGCWLLVNGNEGAIVEMPPYNAQFQESPANKALHVVKKSKIRIKYLLCTHTHVDHFNLKIAQEMQSYFPQAEIHLQRGFEPMIHGLNNVHYFDHESNLSLNGESLFLVHAPKHSWTDTMVIFKGVAITGDWELNTLKSAHDDKPQHRVPREAKIASIQKMRRFQSERNYRIHKVYSVHANDRRENINFDWLMDDTLVDRSF